jgi:hypothetical protein
MLRARGGFSQLAFQAPPVTAPRRVVVTGLGAVTPFGVGVQRAWDALLDSQCAISVRRCPDKLVPTTLI